MIRLRVAAPLVLLLVLACSSQEAKLKQPQDAGDAYLKEEK